MSRLDGIEKKLDAIISSEFEIIKARIVRISQCVQGCETEADAKGILIKFKREDSSAVMAFLCDDWQCVIEKTEPGQASEIMVNLTLENADDFWQLLGRAVFPWI